VEGLIYYYLDTQAPFSYSHAAQKQMATKNQPWARETTSKMTNNNHPVLIIGGGISGIVCALELHRLGVPVMMIEKEAYRRGLSELCSKMPS
jgi:heterodisulfide reductase subunit A-like polyferredoxin